MPPCFIYILIDRPSSGPRAVVNRLGREADKWKRQVQVQRSSVYDTHSMLNWWQDSVEAAGAGPAIQRLRHPLHAQLMAGQCGSGRCRSSDPASTTPSPCSTDGRTVWKRQVQVQRSSVYDTHSMLNWWQVSVEATGPGTALQRLRHTLHAQLMTGQCGRRQVQVQRSSVYDTHSMLNWWQDSVWPQRGFKAVLRVQVQRSSVYDTHSMLNWWHATLLGGSRRTSTFCNLMRFMWKRQVQGSSAAASTTPTPCSTDGRRTVYGHSEGFKAVLRIRIRRIRMFLGLLDPDPDPLVRGMHPDPDPQKVRKNLYSACFVTSFCLFIFEK